MEDVTYEEFKKSALIVRKFLLKRNGDCIFTSDFKKNHAEIALLVALGNPDLYLPD